MKTADTKAAPIAWQEITGDEYDFALECVPPIAWLGGFFLEGEAHDHNADGTPVYRAFTERAGKFWRAERALTHTEFRAEAAFHGEGGE